jgi:signal transduction histidine kinase
LTRPHFSRFPVSLTAAGLAGAVRELTDDSQIPVRVVRVETTTERRPRPAAEAALYRLVLDSVRLAERCGNGAPVTVRVESGDDSVSVQITAPSVDAAPARPALEHAADRLAALNSELTITTAGNDLILKATVPCAS